MITGRTAGEEVERGEFVRSLDKYKMFEGDEFTVQYSLMFRSSRPRLVEIAQPLPPGVRGSAATERMIIAGSAELALRLNATSRGTYTLAPCTVTVSDIAAITFQKFSFGGNEEIEISTRVQKISLEALKPLNPKTVSGNSISRYRGSGSEFYSLRKYEEGESIRRINWRASAKSADLWVNEYLAESSGIQILVIDGRMIEEDSELTREMTDMGIRAAASIAYSSLNEKNGVGMFVIAERASVIRPDYGMRQYLRITEMLRNVNPPTYRSPVRMDRMAKVYGDPKAQYIVITPLTDDETMNSAAELALSHEDVLVIVPLVHVPARAETPKEMALTLIRLQQETNTIVLSQLCRALTWQREDELSVSIRKAAIARVRRRT